MNSDQLKAMYRRWLLQEWSEGNYAVAEELIAEDLIDRNPLPGQPQGRAGEIWTAKMIRKAFPDARFEADIVVSDGEYVIGRWTGDQHGPPSTSLGCPRLGGRSP